MTLQQNCVYSVPSCERTGLTRAARATFAGISAALVAIAAGSVSAQQVEVSDEVRQRITEAAPAAATVAPLKERRLLVYNRCTGYPHGSIPVGDVAFEVMGTKTGAYRAEVTNDPNVFKSERLAEFDAILLNNTTGVLFEDEELKASLLAFVESGKGLIGVHAATDCFYDWPEFGELIGGFFDGHPWNEDITLKLDDPDHPLNAAFQGDPLVVADEIYQFRDPYTRDNLRVLLSLDPDGTDFSKGNMKRDDGDYAVSWVRSYGHGRVFYCSLGHRNDIFWNPKVLQHYLDGIQFALGDLPADTTPSTEWEAAGRPSSGHGMSLEQALAATAQYEFGQSREPLSALAGYVQRATLGSADDQWAMEQALIGLLNANGSTLDARRFACRQLAVIGGNGAVDLLCTKLLDDELSDMARYALDRIPSARVDEALAAALPGLSGASLIGTLNTMGNRGNSTVQGAILSRISDGVSDDERVAAIGALGKVGTANVPVEYIQSAFFAHADTPSSAMGRASAQAMLVLAERLANTETEQSNPELAASLFAQLYDAKAYPRHVRAAGLTGLCRHFGNDARAVDPVLSLLDHSPDEWWQNTAARMIVYEMPGDEITRGLGSSLRSRLWTVGGKVRMIQALADRGNPRGLGPVYNTMMSLRPDDPDEVLMACIQAISTLGGAESVPALLAISSGKCPQGERPEAIVSAAREALLHLPGSDLKRTLDVLIHSLESRSTGVCMEAARALGGRGVTEATEPIAELLMRPEPKVRTVAWAALAKLADASRVAELGARYVRIDLDADADEVETAAATMQQLCAQSADPDQDVTLVLDKVESDNVACVIRSLEVCAWLGGDEALDAVRTTLNQSSDPAIRLSTLRAMCSWKDAAPLEEVFLIASKTDDLDMHAVAFEGYLRLLALPSKRSARIDAALYKRAVPIAVNDEEHRALLAGLAGVRHELAAEVAESYLQRETLRTDGAVCMIRVAGRFGDLFAEQALAVINKAVRACPGNEEVRLLAGETVNHIERRRDYVSDWLYSGPHTKDQTGGGNLINVPFKPEPGGTEGPDVTWQPVPEEAILDGVIVDFLRFIPGSDRCIYLKTGVWSEREREVRFELGSDDGVKVWLNGDVIHNNNAMRGLSLGQDVVNTTLKEGWNTLLLKITQGGGDWRAACRIRSTDGFHVDGLRVDSSEQGH
ncbi:MAG: hypothetical protein D8M59_00150 [Planctomycetes bacterium]|nr:hypothetical protein [Planctomycetota bacterium]NOG54870.1 hypothetical protein [Planctomycetota bacterium]